MKKRMRSIISTIFFLVFTLVFSVFGTEVKAEENMDRIWGKDRYETAVKVSREGWSKGSETVIIVRGDDFPDGLCAAPLAKKYSAPILLTYNKSLPQSVEKEINRLNPKNVFILGGSGVVSEKIEENLKNDGLNVKRIGGKNRYETSFLIAKELGQVDSIAVATGRCFADSLSISSIAANKGMPILLVDGNKISKDIINHIKQNEVKESYILGSSVIVSSEIEKELPSPKRLWGKDRYETNLEILKEFEEEIDFKKVYISLAQGDNDGIDALSASALAAQNGQPIILSGRNKINNKLKDYISSKLDKDSKVVALGSEKIVSNSVIESIKESIKEDKDKEGQGKEDKDKDKDKDKEDQGKEDQDKSEKFVFIISKDNEIILQKDLKIDEEKSAYDYLKENATVEDDEGLIVKINDHKSIPFDDLSEEEKKKGIMGKDWFIYLNGSKTSVGATGVYPEKGDTLKFDYHSWDWKEFSSMDAKMPLVIKSPKKVKAGEIFKVEVKCYGYPIYNAKVTLNNVNYYTDINGEVILSSNLPGEYEILVEKEGTIKGKTITVNPIETKPSPKPDAEDKKDEVLMEGNEQNVQFKIVKDTKGNINIDVKSIQIKQDRITIIIYDEKENLAYINQNKLQNGEIQFKTKLKAGKYKLHFRLESMENKIITDEFNIK